jgi:hypothetical protein
LSSVASVLVTITTTSVAPFLASLRSEAPSVARSAV